MMASYAASSPPVPEGPVCDVLHCGGTRRHNYRLCNRCDCRLPADLRVGIVAAHEQRRYGDWNAMRAEAAAFFNLPNRAPVAAVAPAPETPRSVPAPVEPRVSSAQAYEMQARLLGERPDA